MAKDNPFDPDLVRELATLIAETDLTEIEVEKGDLRIRVARTVTRRPVPCRPPRRDAGRRSSHRPRPRPKPPRRQGRARDPPGRRAVADGRHRLSQALAGRQGLRRGGLEGRRPATRCCSSRR